MAPYWIPAYLLIRFKLIMMRQKAFFSIPIFSFSILFAILFLGVKSNAQMDKWILTPNEIDFEIGVSSPIVSGAFNPYKVENAVYKDGDLLFYVNDGQVYSFGGNWAGQFASDPAAMLKEVAIAPGPGTCNNYCLFWLETFPLAELHFYYQEILIDNGDITFGLGGELVPGILFGNSGGIAISKILDGTEADRDVYLVTRDAVRRFRMDAQGVTLHQTILVNSSENIWEADLSHNGEYLGWGAGNQLFAMETASPNLVNVITIGDNSHQVSGIEFSPDNAFLYFTDSELGLRRWEINGSITNLSEANTYRFTQLELAMDGFIYAVRDDGMLGRIEGLSVQQSPLNLAVYSSVPPAPSLFSTVHYALPDQIDGEDYSLFLGVQAMAFDAFTINGEEVFDFIDQDHPPLWVYNCSNINLETALSGTPLEYFIHVYSVDPVTGQQISGPGFLDFTFNSPGVPPVTIDLRCLEDSQCMLFNDAVASGHFTFAVEMTLTSRCETISQKGYVEVFDAPVPAQIGLEVNNLSGIPCPASQDIVFPCLAGIYSASINFSNSQGDISFYQLVVEEVNCESGAVISLLYVGPQVLVAGVSSLTSLPLNGLTINGNTGFFADPEWVGRCLKVTATVGNDCGASTDYSFLKFNGTYLGNPGSSSRITREDDAALSLSQKLSIQAFPNPFSHVLSVQVIMHQEGIATVRIYNLSGQEVATLIRETFMTEGLQNFALSTENLPTGIYYVQIETDKANASFRVVKMN